MRQPTIYFADINDPDETGTYESNYCHTVLAADYDALTDELEALNDEIIDHRNYTKACRDRDEAQKARAALAPAAVVMPERMTTIPEGKTISYAAGHEAALDAVARLNRNTVPLELLERIARDYTGRRGWDALEPDRLDAVDELRAILALAGAKP